MKNKTRIALLIGVGVILVGCTKVEQPTESWDDPFFPRDDITPPSKVMFDRQAANGAAADAMLFDIHFDGGELNSLGEQKLSLMVKGRSTKVPLKVFLNMSKDAETSAARQSAVEASLTASGLAKEQVAVQFGPNPAVLMPADAGIRALSPVGPAPVSTASETETAP